MKKWIKGDNMLDLKDIYKDYEKYLDKEITLSGWIKSHRKQKPSIPHITL